MSGALPLLLAAILTPAGTWHVGAPGPSARAHAATAVAQRAAGTGQASERSIVGRGPDRRGAMPASGAGMGSAAVPGEHRPATSVATGRAPRAVRGTARARAPPR